MKIIKIVAAIVFSLFGAGCGNNLGKLPGVEEIFETEILENNTKLFTFSLAESHTNTAASAVFDETGTQARHDSIARSGRDPRFNVTIQYLRARVEMKLAENGYCREGYLELDAALAITQTFIRGECREAATERDIQRFSD